MGFRRDPALCCGGNIPVASHPLKVNGRSPPDFPVLEPQPGSAERLQGSRHEAASTGARFLTVPAPRRVRGAGTGACAPPGRLHCARAPTPRGARLRRARRGGGRREGPDEGWERRGGRPRGRLPETGTRVEKRGLPPRPCVPVGRPERTGGGRWGGSARGPRAGRAGARGPEVRLAVRAGRRGGAGSPSPGSPAVGASVAGSWRPPWGGGGVGAAHGPGRGCLVSVSLRLFNFRMRYRQVCGTGRTLLRRPNLDRPGALGRASRAQ